MIMSLFNALRGKEKFTGKHLLIVGGCFIFLGLFTAGSISYTSQSAFCGTCHEMKPMHDTWTTSSHKNVDCIACHSEPGLKGQMEVKANGLKQVYVHLTASNITPKAPAEDVNCLSCHQGKVVSNTERALTTKDPHTSKHFANGMNCLSCHSGLVHDVKVNNTVPSRERCVTCHLNQMDI